MSVERHAMAGVSVELVQGDITRQSDIDAVVNAANAQLRPGGGVAGAIHRAAGPGLDVECRSFAPISTGQAVVTSGHEMVNRFVVHCLGPVYGVDEPSDQLLAACYRNALSVADERGIRSIAFPAISTGVFGYPLAEAADVAVDTVALVAPDLVSVRLVRFVLFDDGSMSAHSAAFRRRA